MPALNSSCMEEPRSFMWKNLRPAPLDQLLLLHGRALQTKTYRSIAAPSPIAPAVRLAGELVASSAEVCRSRPCRSENVILRWSVPFVLADNVMHASRGSMSWLQQVESTWAGLRKLQPTATPSPEVLVQRQTTHNAEIETSA
jgi:hypothetical protein